MRIAPGALVAAVLALTAAAPAPAARYETLSYVQAGPAFAGTGTAWVDGFDANMFVKRAPLDGPPVTLFTVKRLGICDEIEDLAASAELVAVTVRRTGDENSNCNTIGKEFVVGDGTGDPRVLEDTKVGTCGPTAMDVSGGLVAIARQGCLPDSIVIHDVKAGTSDALGFALPEGHVVESLRFAGRYVAIAMRVWGGSMAKVVVWDRELDTKAYEVDGGTLWDKMDDAVRAHISLHADGRLLVASQTFGTEWASVRYGWASIAEPALHRIPGTYDMPGGRFAFAGDLMAVPIAYGKGQSVVGFDGVVTNPFSLDTIRESIDFDGARIVWADRWHVYNEAYPYTPPKEEPPPTFMPPPAKPPVVPPKPFSVPAAVVTVKAVVKAKSLKSFRGTAADADGDLALVRVGVVRTVGKRCQTLQKSGRLKTSKKVGGRCVPAVFHDATGTSTWKLKLRKRLPAGRYTIYAQAVDAAGHAQTSFTKAASSMLSFRVR